MKRLFAGCLVMVVTVISVSTGFGHDGAHKPHPGSGDGAKHEELRQVRIKVTSKGFEPSTVRVHAGERLTLLITRKTDKTCAKELVIPSLGTKEVLPLNKTIRVYIGAQQAGRIAFACGMDMIKGEIVVQE
ncbi:MAG TPA: cupredoxin domain-containing protein [Candidatus Polarisedimenticolia bacterium]|nr:cupredoxin domain-containing protein [Candidatus Polarisedimenticolia bacterium]